MDALDHPALRAVSEVAPFSVASSQTQGGVAAPLLSVFLPLQVPGLRLEERALGVDSCAIGRHAAF